MSVPSLFEFAFNPAIRLQSLARQGAEGAALEILNGRFTFSSERRNLLRLFFREPYGQEATHPRDAVISRFVESVIRRRLRVGFHAIARSVADYSSPGERALATEFAAMVDHLCPCAIDPPFVDFSFHSDEDSKEKWEREHYPTLSERKLLSTKVELGGVSCFSWDVFKNPRMDKVWRYKFSDNDVVEYPLQLFRHVRLSQARTVYRPEWRTLLKRTLRPSSGELMLSLAPAERDYQGTRSINVLPLLPMPWRFSLGVSALENLYGFGASCWFEPLGAVKDWSDFLNRTVEALGASNSVGGMSSD